MKTFALATAALLTATAMPASAQSLNGSTVTATLLFPNTSTTYAGPVTTVVGPQVEFPAGTFAGPQGTAAGSFDISGNTVTFFSNQFGSFGTTSGANAFNGYMLSFAGRTLTSVMLGAGTTFTPNSVTLSGSSFMFDVSGQDPQGGKTVFQVGVAGAVPEPATWGMLILGFGAMGVAMRRRAKVRTSVTYA